MKLDETTPLFTQASVGFAADVRSAALALINRPIVALVPILVWWCPTSQAPKAAGTAHLNPWIVVEVLVLMLFQCGWAGAERIFFFRSFEGRPVTLWQLLRLVVPFMGRFVALALLVGIVGMAGAVLGALTVGGSPKAHPVAVRVGATSFVVVVDFVLTFVPSALAFTTRSVRSALRIGFAMLRQTWPRCAVYVLCPPLALNTTNLVYPSDLPMLRLIVVAGLAVVALLAKGATVAFYLRERPVGSDDGAAHIM